MLLATKSSRKLESSAVLSVLQGFDYAELSYGECMDLMQEVLELPNEVPLEAQDEYDDFAVVVVLGMIEAGYKNEVAWKCRNSAASKAHKVPLNSLPLRDKVRETELLLGIGIE